MYWREKPVVGVEEAELPQFTIEGYETNERKIKLATGEPKFIVKISLDTVFAFSRQRMISNTFEKLEELKDQYRK